MNELRLQYEELADAVVAERDAALEEKEADLALLRQENSQMEAKLAKAADELAAKVQELAAKEQELQDAMEIAASKEGVPVMAKPVGGSMMAGGGDGR